MFRNRLSIPVMVLAVLLAAAFSAGALFAADVPRMSTDDLKSKLGSAGLVVIDVRTDKDWKESAVKVKGAVREDPSTVTMWMDKYAKDKTIVLYCA